MHMGAARDCRRRDADNFPVFPHIRADRYVAKREFVPHRDCGADLESLRRVAGA